MKHSWGTHKVLPKYGIGGYYECQECGLIMYLSGKTYKVSWKNKDIRGNPSEDGSYVGRDASGITCNDWCILGIIR